MDLLIVVQPHDVVWLRYTLPTTQRVVQPVRTYLLTYAVDEIQTLFPDCTVVSLTRLPFTYTDVCMYVPVYTMTYLVQLARLYAPDILVLPRPVLFLDADAVILQPVPPVGTRHGTNPYVFAHLHALHPTLRKELPQSADVPYYVGEPQRIQALHRFVSDTEPFWRVYLASLPPYSTNQGASDKELYALTQRPPSAPIVWKRLRGYAEVTPLLADAQGVHVATCPPASQSVLTCFQTSPWTRVQRWLGSTPLTTLPVPPAALTGFTPGTVVHFGCGEAPVLTPWVGWTYIGVDTEDCVLSAHSRLPSVAFTSLDVCVDPLPYGTLAVCTEFLTRLSYAHALTFLLRLRRAYPTILFVDYVPKGAPRINVDHPTGDWGVIWWDLPPFNVWGVRPHGRVPLEEGDVTVHLLETSAQAQH